MTEPTVLVLGAGASRAETTCDEARSDAEQAPAPLDTDFLAQLHERDEALTAALQREFWIQDADFHKYFGMEEVFGSLFEEVLSGRRATVRELIPGWVSSETPDSLFAKLLRAYASIIGDSTNAVGGPEYPGPIRQVIRALGAEARERLAIITFNQDLLAERAIDDLGAEGLGLGNWGLPGAYVGMQFEAVRELRGTQRDLGAFRRTDDTATAPLILKLHGSLNWMMRVRGEIPVFSDWLDKGPEITLDTGKAVLTVKQREVAKGVEYTLWPLVVPPVFQKDSWIDKQLAGTWAHAERLLAEAARVVFWGYSFPSADFRATCMIRRALASHSQATRSGTDVVVVNPDIAAAARAWDLLRPHHLVVCRSHEALLERLGSR